MQQFSNLTYQSPILIDQFFRNDRIHMLYLSKSLFPAKGKDQYFLKIFHYTSDKRYICEGYIYFYLDFEACESNFIGAFVKPEYRNQGLASYLYAAWIKLCLENDIYNVNTNAKQRKPFLLYQLKTFSFEIEDPDMYEKSRYTINVCQKFGDNTKYLHFKIPEFAKNFQHSSILEGDNYSILDSIDEDTTVLDNVLLSTPYSITNHNEAYSKSQKIYINQQR